MNMLNRRDVVEWLRKGGYKVRITHVRDTWPVYSCTEKGVCYFSKYEFEKLKQSGMIYHCMDDNIPPYNKAIHSTGGFTVVEVKCPDGTELRGKYSFGRRPYVKKLGVRIALNKAFGLANKKVETCA